MVRILLVTCCTVALLGYIAYQRSIISELSQTNSSLSNQLAMSKAQHQTVREMYKRKLKEDATVATEVQQRKQELQDVSKNDQWANTTISPSIDSLLKQATTN